MTTKQPYLRCVAAILALFCIGVNAENHTKPIWPALAPGSEHRPNNEKWVGTTKVTSVYQPELTAFPLPPGLKKLPALLIFPGGGYTQVVMDKEGYQIARWANQHGMAAFVLKYRLNQDFALRDAQRAMSYLRAHGEAYAIDPNKIGVIGFSAGAHLAANLTLNANNRDKLDAIDNESSKPDFFIGVYSGYPDIFGPLGSFKVEGEFAPTFLVHASKDEKANVFGSIELYATLLKKNIPAELHIYEQGGHGFALQYDREPAVASTVNAWSRRCIEWLKVRMILD